MIHKQEHTLIEYFLEEGLNPININSSFSIRYAIMPFRPMAFSIESYNVTYMTKNLINLKMG